MSQFLSELNKRAARAQDVELSQIREWTDKISAQLKDALTRTGQGLLGVSEAAKLKDPFADVKPDLELSMV
jgi:hypothetical protein